MTHRAESITAAVVTTVTGLTTTGTRVFRGRVRTVETAPAITVSMGGDDIVPEQSAYPRQYRDLHIKITSHVENNTAPDTQLNLIREEVYNALLADRTLGLAYVIDIALIGDDEPELSGEAEKITGSQQMNFVVKYFHSWSDAGA